MAACKQLTGIHQTISALLSVYDSQTNFLLCRVHPPYSSTSIAEHCLLNHQILITDLCGKEGFEDSQHVRLAVRNEAENNALITAFSAFATEAI